MKINLLQKGKTFYAILRLLVICIAVPILVSLILTQRTLRRSHDTLQSNLGATLETQITYIQEAAPGRNHMAQLSTLRENTILAELGAREKLVYGADVKTAEEILHSVTPSYSKNGRISTFLYFPRSNYLISNSLPGGNAIGTTDNRIFCGLEKMNFSYTGTPRAFLYGPESHGKEAYSIYTATVFPDVIFIFEIYFPQYPVSNRSDTSLYDVFTSNLKDVEMCYYDSYGNVRITNGPGELTSLYSYATLGPESNSSFTFRHNGHHYLCHYVFNEHTTTKFALFCRDEIAEEQYRNSILIWVSGGLLLITCLAWAFFYTRHTYRPINTLVNRLNRGPGDTSRNEFEMLSEAMDSYDDRLNKQNRMLSKYYLIRLLRGQKVDTLDVPQDEWFNDADDLSYVVAALRVDEFQGGTLYDEVQLESNVISFFKSLNIDIRTAFDSDFLFVAFRLPRSFRDVDLQKHFRTLQQQLAGYYISVYISDVHTSLRELRRCYNEAIAISEYYVVNEKINIIANRATTPQVDSGFNASTPNFGHLHKLSDCIIALSADEALSALDDLAFQFTKANGHPLHAESPLFNILANTVALAVHDVDVPGDINKAALQQRITTIRGSSGIAELRQHLQDTLQFLSRRSDGQEYYQRFEMIRDYIQEHYPDPNLDAASIAEFYNTSPSTITRLFKKFNNTGFLEYVHQTRVNRAIVLLQQTDLSITEISSLVGYTNTATMNRAFKAQVNSTPGMIRKQAQKEQERK